MANDINNLNFHFARGDRIKSMRPSWEGLDVPYWVKDL